MSSETTISNDKVYVPSSDIVAREIDGEIILVPLRSGIGDMEDDLFSLNETAKAIWQKLHSNKSIHQIAKELSEEYDQTAEQIETSIIGLFNELHQRGIIIEATTHQ